MNFVCFQLLPSEVIFPVKRWLCRVQMYCRLKPVFSFSRNRNSVHSVQPLKFVLRIMETKAIVLQKVAVLSFFKLFIARNLKKKPEIFHTYIISTCDVTCMIKILLCIYLDSIYFIYTYVTVYKVSLKKYEINIEQQKLLFSYLDRQMPVGRCYLFYKTSNTACLVL